MTTAGLHQVGATGAGAARSVFLHGLGGTGRYWTCTRPARPDALYVDLYGFGDSPRPLLRYTPDRHLDALETTLAGQTGYVLVGHSLGAALALAYAAHHPDDVAALVLIGLPHYGSRRAASRWLRHRPTGWITTNLLATAAACVVTRRVLGRILPRLLRDYPREVAEDLVKHNVLSSTTSLWEVLYRQDLAAVAAAIPDHIPVHLIHGAADTTAPADGARSLAVGRPGWHVTVLPGVDHHPWLRAPAACEQVLRTVGADVLGSGGEPVAAP